MFIRTVTMLRNGQIFDSPCIEEKEVDTARHASKETQWESCACLSRCEQGLVD